MKAVIIGTDLLKDSNGNLRIIETNTNVDIHNKIVPNLDWTSFNQFLIDNSINNLHLIVTEGNILPSEKDGAFSTNLNDVSIKDKMDEIITDLGGSFTFHKVAFNSITVPYIEDNDNTLIIRTSYDTTAVVDEEYAKDKVNFHRLIKDKPYSPNVFYSSDLNPSLNIDQLTDLHITNGDTPNYIVKTSYAGTNISVYPKFYKVTSLEDLQSLKNSLDESEYMEEYHTHSDNIVNEKMGVIRSLDILYGGTLSCLHLGSYMMTSVVKNNEWATEYDSNGLMLQPSRVLWMTKSSKIGSDAYILDDDTKILNGEGNLVLPSQIVQNSTLKTLVFPWVPIDDQIIDGVPNFLTGVNSSNFADDLTGFTITSTNVQEITGVQKECLMIKVTLENGLSYEDLAGSNMVIEEFDTLRTTHSLTNTFRINDSIVFYDYINNTLTKSKITNLEVVYVNRMVYDMNVEQSDVFLPVLDETLGLAFIQHNPCYGWCERGSGCSWWECGNCSYCRGGGGEEKI
jgi:hypothetical protein